MKLRVTIEKRSYEVDVEVLDAPADIGSAAMRVRSSPVVAPPKPPNHEHRTTPSGGPSSATPIVPPVAAPSSAAAHAADHLPPKPAWHGLSVGAPGETCSPIPGVITSVQVKVGDALKAHDPVVVLQVAHVYAAGEVPMVGTVRTPTAGTVKEVLVQKGDIVAAGQVLARVG